MPSSTTALLCIWTVLWCSSAPAQSACYDRGACIGCDTAAKSYIFDCCLGSVTEKQGPNQYAGYVWSYPNITQSAASTFSIADTAAASTFVVAPNGTLWTNKSLDWNQTACWAFAIAITTGGNHQTVIVAVGVIDTNDYPPVINGLPAIVNTSVTRYAGGVPSLCYLVTDRDVDFGSYVTVPTVRIVAGDGGGLFQVTVSSISQQPIQTSACITNTGSLDGRNASRYNLTLLASDQGTPPLNSTTWIVIQLTGINYYAPVFTPLQPLRPLPDNTASGTVIQTFVATDNDTGENGKVRYSIQSVLPQTSTFSINATSGALVLGSPFASAIATPQYNVCVTATDMSPTFPLSSSICTSIVVLPSSPPATTLTTTLSPCPVSIAENVWNATVNTFYFSSTNAIRCTILQSAANFSVATSRFLGSFYQCSVGVSGFLDYEKASQLTITLGVTWDVVLPFDSFGLYNNYTCTVNVINSNDNVPQLNGTHFAFVENQPLGSYVAQLIGYDLDHGANGMIAAYLLVGVSNATTDLTSLNLFDLDPASGLLTTKALVKRKEVGKKLNVTVNVTDAGSPPLSSVIVVQLDVVGALAFTASSYSFFLFKNMPAPVTVGHVEATTDDVVSTISYQLVTSSMFFAVDVRGNVTSLVSFGNSGVYQFGVLASDHGSLSVSGTAMVTVNVLDICSRSRVLTVSSPIMVGQSVGGVLEDSGGIGVALNYRTLNSSELFDINLNSGELTVKSLPLLSPSYTLVFVVFNPNSIAISTQCSVTLLVPTSFDAGVIIGTSVGIFLSLLLVLSLCGVIIAFNCYKRGRRGKLPILDPSRSCNNVQLSDLTRGMSPPKSILSPVASPAHAASSKSNGSVKFSYKAEEFLVNQEESVDKVDTSIKKYSNVKFSDSPQMAPRGQPAKSTPDQTSRPSREYNPPLPQSPSSSSSGAPAAHPLLYPPPHPHSMPHPARGYPLTREDMLDHSLATHGGHTHHLSDANSCDDSTYYDDNTSIRNTEIPRFKQGSDEPLASYVGPSALRGSSPPSFLPPLGTRGVPPVAVPASFAHREYLSSPTPPQHSSSSRGSTPPLRGGGYAPAPPVPQMVPQPGPPPTCYPEVMPSALDHSEMSSSMTQSRYSPTESYCSSALDDELRFQQDDMEKDFYNLTYNEDASEL